MNEALDKLNTFQSLSIVLDVIRESKEIKKEEIDYEPNKFHNKTDKNHRSNSVKVPKNHDEIKLSNLKEKQKANQRKKFDVLLHKSAKGSF